MNTPVHLGPAGLPELADACANDLFSSVQHKFQFPPGSSLQHWDVERIKMLNSDFLGSLRHRGNVYALYVCTSEPGAEWTKMYVGERKSSGLRERITQHLINKNARTGSMLEAVKTAVSAGSTIGLSFIKVQPESLRLFVEETIIAKYKSELPWNTHA